jgi:hypothetical protein
LEIFQKATHSEIADHLMSPTGKFAIGSIEFEHLQAIHKINSILTKGSFS